MFSKQETLFFLQGKSSSDLSADDVFDAFRKMKDSVEHLEKREFSGFNKKLISAFENAYDEIGENKDISLVLFTNTEFQDSFLADFEKFKAKDEYSRFDLFVYDKVSINAKLIDKSTGSELVKEGVLQLFNKEKDALTYCNGNEGAIVNASAASIQLLFNKFHDKGLFSFNLREHINKNKDVDDAILRSIQKEPSNFWFYNNGITIACKDFRLDGNNVKLYDFSIINGAQTTTNIGKAEIPKGRDFAVVCKLIKAERDMDDKFISQISEASNSQKPISYRDIKSNHREQKNLQKICGDEEKDYRLAVEIKRGRHCEAYSRVQNWERVTNEELGQLILACLLQQPGPARTAKATLFTNQSRYKIVYRRKHDAKTLHSIVWLSSIYDDYKNKETQKNATQGNEAEMNLSNGILKNGKYVVLAVVLYLLKKQRGLCQDSNDVRFQADNIDGELIERYPGDDLDKNLFLLFGFILKEIKTCYLTKKDGLKVTSISNFFKNDEYYKLILEHFDRLDSWDMEKVETFMKVFTYRK